jgi:protein phosphatase
MRGNHEAPSEFPFSSHDLPYVMKGRFGPDAKAAYGKVLSFFRMLTLTVVVKDSLLLVHGGLPTDPGVAENYRGLVATAQENHVRNRVMEELLWNDPRPIEGGPGWEESRRGIGRHFGMAVTERWLAATGARIVVRGHEPCRGYKIDHGGKVMTIFTSKEAYPGYAAACILVGRAQLASVDSAGDLVQHVVKL